MNFGSLFVGIGGFDLAFGRVGMTCAWQVEIDDKCNQVLGHHWPDVPRYGDVRDVGKRNLRAVDLICGGYPCQDYSVAGKREGLAGKRSGLWFEFHRILAELKPRWVVIENVPGLLSSDGGRDFATVLQGLAEIGYLSAWRILDAQYSGLAQRRRRLFIVGSLGNGRCAEVLFESEGSAWNPPPCRKAGARVTAHTPSGFGEYCQQLGTLGRSGGDLGGGSEMLIAPSLTAHSPRNNIENEAFVAYTIQTNDGGNHKRKDRPQGGMYVNEADAALTLGSSDQTVIAWHENQQGELTPDSDGIAKALHAGASYSYQGVGVRRLTPTECERLQGFPDNWTAVNGMSDSARYRQLGNAVAVPVVEWIGKRIAKYDDQEQV